MCIYIFLLHIYDIYMYKSVITSDIKLVDSLTIPGCNPLLCALQMA